jgi:carbonic anhydrase/acetyltransferase-like protein (isoleucine patch superfamily)
MLIPFESQHPDLDESVYVAEGAKIIGNVTVGKSSSIWFNTVIRGDEAPITIGERCNVQDNCTLHLYEDQPLILEDEVSIGHNVILHGCRIKRGALIGMGSIILDGAEIGEGAFIAANTLIPPGKKIPPHTMVMGSPGKVVRDLNQKDKDLIRLTIETYEKKGKLFKAQQR